MKKIAIVILLFMFLLSSCVKEGGANVAERQSFFDLKQYFKEEVARLEGGNIHIKKTITNKGELEQKKISDLDWSEELALFVKGDINKPSFIEKYTIDSTFGNQGELTQLLYKTEDEAMYTQNLDIEFKDGEVHSIIIVNNVSNAVYASQQYLKYIPSIGYSIDKTQDVTLFDKENYKVEVEFMKP
ncbi:MAG: hypothetical protein GY810_29755 [Aureispira sp.]|nr:hypothetical protein [Aureispira sp.]